MRKKVKFWPPSWPQVGPKTGPERAKKGTKKGTYVKIPFGTQLGANLGSFWGRFWGQFWAYLGVFFLLFFLCLLCAFHCFSLSFHCFFSDFSMVFFSFSLAFSSGCQCLFALSCAFSEPSTSSLVHTLTRFPFPLSQVFFLSSFSFFFQSSFWMEVKRPEKEFLWGSRRLLGPTWPILGLNLAPKRDPKWSFLGVQEATYLKIGKNVKI